MKTPTNRAAGLVAAAATVLLALLPSLAFAHAGAHDGGDWAWPFTPDILTGTLIAAVLYVAGLRRLRGRGASPAQARIVCFFVGLMLIFVALQSPLDALADRSFAFHQVQHLLLHAAGPMFVMLGLPQGPMAAGLPAAFRRWIVQPATSSRLLRALFGALSHAAVATMLFIGSLYFWQIPRYHEMAVLDDGVHYGMHVSMLLAGLFFFRCVFDPRPEPFGAPVRTRMLIVWTALASNIVLGAYTALKSRVLYGAYDLAGRVWGIDALADEQLGGLVAWIPGSMMYVVAALLLLDLWNRQEIKADERRRRGLPPAGAAHPPRADAPALRGAADNRSLALKLGIVAVAVFAIVLAIGGFGVARLHVQPAANKARIAPEGDFASPITARHPMRFDKPERP